jgi:hypothetical protein
MKISVSADQEIYSGYGKAEFLILRLLTFFRTQHCCRKQMPLLKDFFSKTRISPRSSTGN